MLCVVATAVTQVDPADKCDVACSPTTMADDNELLVVGAAETHALVEKNLASRRIDQNAKVAVLFGAKSKPVRM